MRRIDNATIQPSPNSNLIIGENGSGKTSLLESIHYLSFGRSFRTNRVREVISHGQTAMLVSSEIQGQDGHSYRIGIEKTGSSTRFRLDGQALSVASKAARLLPVLTFNSESSSLLDGGPSNRRALLDRLLFHVEPTYFEELKLLYRILKQRNTLLRTHSPIAEIAAWNDRLIAVSQRMDAHRSRCIAEMNKELERGSLNSAVGDIELEYRRGWPDESELEESLAKNLNRDRETGNTNAGPHRAELRIKQGGKAAKSIVSRGQGKLIIASLVAAQASFLWGHAAEPPVLLIDDLASELDRKARKAATEGLQATGSQIFFTAIDTSDLPAEVVDSATMFHVEHGQLNHFTEGQITQDI